jgi:hypothetical protein
MRQQKAFPSAKLSEINELYNIFYESLILKLEQKNNFLTLDNVDHKYYEFNNHISILNDQSLSFLFSNINEKEIIKQTKEEYKQIGITLRTNVRSSITIQGEDKKITIKRYLLTPVSKADDEQLYRLEGRHGIYPLDKLIGISNLPFKLTVQAMLKVAKKAQESMSFKEAQIALREEGGITLDVCTICDVSNYVGYIVFKQELEKANNYYRSLINGTLCLPTEKKQGVLYFQIDGSMVNTREKDKTGSSWRENKLALVYNSNNMKPVFRTIKNKIEERYKIEEKAYTSYIGSVNEFKKLFFGLACNNEYGSYNEVVLISDGADWIANLKDELMPEATHILDFFHVSEKIWDLGRSYFNNDVPNYTKWCKYICAKIENSEYKDIRDDILNKEIKVNKQNIKLKDDLKNTKLVFYLDNRINNIDYKLFKNKGYTIGSGAIEGSNKYVIQNRLKLSGMSWNRHSAQAMSTLRCKYKSGLWFSDVVIPVRRYFNLL